MNIDCDWCICGKRALDVNIFSIYFVLWNIYVFSLYIFNKN